MSDDRENESGKRERSGFGPIVVLLILAMPLLYFLSTGPVLWLERRGYSSETTDSVLRAVYGPVRFLIENSDTFAKVFKHWASLWQS